MMRMERPAYTFPPLGAHRWQVDADGADTGWLIELSGNLLTMEHHSGTDRVMLGSFDFIGIPGLQEKVDDVIRPHAEDERESDDEEGNE